MASLRSTTPTPTVTEAAGSQKHASEDKGELYQHHPREEQQLYGEHESVQTGPARPQHVHTHTRTTRVNTEYEPTPRLDFTRVEAEEAIREVRTPNRPVEGRSGRCDGAVGSGWLMDSERLVASERRAVASRVEAGTRCGCAVTH